MGGQVAVSYRVRHSARAKRLILKVDPWGEVEVVVPLGVVASAVTAFVARHDHWLQQARERVAQRRADETVSLAVPARVDLPALGESWAVDWQQQGARGCRVRAAEQTLVLRGVTTVDAPGILQTWLQRHAAAALSPWLSTVAAECGIAYATVGVRAQRSRWGSCSSRGHISLNRNLLFMSPDVVRYLLVHELCHVQQPNHSARFWALVQQHMPDYALYDRILRRGWDHVPLWARPMR